MEAGAAMDAERVTRYVPGRDAMRATSATTSTPRAMPIFFSMEEGSGSGKRKPRSLPNSSPKNRPRICKGPREQGFSRGPVFPCDFSPALEPLRVRVGRGSEPDVALIGDRTVRHHAVGVRRRVDGSEDETDAG